MRSRSLLLVCTFAALLVANARFPSPVTLVTFTRGGNPLKAPFDIEIACIESRDGSPWSKPFQGHCDANPCSNSATAELMLMQHNLHDGYLAACSLKVTLRDAPPLLLARLDLDHALQCARTGQAASSLSCTAVFEFAVFEFSEPR